MYNIKQIEQVAQKYRKTGEDLDFEKVLVAVDPLIDILLGQGYSSIKYEWEDMKQEVFLRLWKNRSILCFTKSKKLYRFLHGRIRDNLNRAVKNV